MVWLTKQTKRQLSALSKGLMEANPDPLVVIDAEGAILDSNDAAARVTGLSREELRGTPFSDHFTQPGLAREKCRLVIERGSIGDQLLTIRRKGGKLAQIRFNGSAYKDAKGKILGVIAVIAMAEEAGRGQYPGGLFDTSLDPLFITSREGTIVNLNQAAVSLTGIAREDTIGTDLASYFTDSGKARDLYRQLREQASVTACHLTIRGKDGELTDLLLNASLLRDTGEEIAGVFVAARDITDIDRLIGDLAESKNLLDSIMQSSTRYSIIGKDLDRRIVTWNEGARRNYGYSAEEMIGKDSRILHAPEDIASGLVDSILATAWEKGIAEGEFTRVRKDGTRFIASVVVTVRHDIAGHPIGYLLMSHDITDKKKAEEQLQQAALYARSLIEASLDPLLTISTDGNITDVNEATTKVTGVSRGDLIGSDFSRYFTDPAQARQGYQRVFEKGFVTDYALTIRHQDGGLTDVLLNASVYKDRNDIVVGAFAAARDITHRKRAHEELERLNEALERRIAERTAQNREILEAANVLASSSSEMMASMTQIAAAVTETAATVNQTTSTVEEVKSTAEQSSQKARKVAEVAQKAVSVGQTGRRAVDDSIDAMGRIQDRVSSTTQSILKLSQQTQAIGEIIATVQDLAEQSNLLSVNAAIEAAKAGEQGKGFAVVAQEVKSLAVQSKEATAQVRRILKEIQDATGAAVSAAEEGNQVVEVGVRQSKQGGEAIRELEESVAESAGAAQQIGASSQQQLTGMDQVATAMQSIKEASDQNALGIRQMETALHRLHELGQKLKRLVEQYS